MYNIMNSPSSTTLAVAMDATQTTMQVTADIYPAVPFLLTIGEIGNFEIVAVTAKSGTTFSIDRGKDGTTAKAFTQGTKVLMNFCAGHLREVQDAIIKLKTTSDITYFVDTSTGTDSNDGLTSETAFKTINKVVSVIPQVVNHTVIINALAGTYAEDILISGFSGGGSITLNGDLTNAVDSLNRIINSMTIKNTQVPIYITGFEATSTKTALQAISSDTIVFDKCKTIAIGETGFAGFFGSRSNITVSNSLISNRYYGIMCSNGTIFSFNNTGTNNIITLYSVDGGVISKDGIQSDFNTSGGALQLTATGGVIQAKSDKVLTITIPTTATYTANTYYDIGDLYCGDPELRKVYMLCIEITDGVSYHNMFGATLLPQIFWKATGTCPTFDMKMDSHVTDTFVTTVRLAVGQKIRKLQISFSQTVSITSGGYIKAYLKQVF